MAKPTAAQAKRDTYTRLQRDILDERARLILREQQAEAAARKFATDLAARWIKQLKAALAKGPTNVAQVAAIRAKLSLIAQLDRSTKAAIDALVKQLAPNLREIYKSSLYRHGYIAQGERFTMSPSTGIAFGGVNIETVAQALASKIPGADQLASFQNLSRATLGRMRADLAKAIIEGWDIDKLARLWANGQGAGRIFRDAEAIARTAMNSAANEAILKSYKSIGKRFIKAVRWEATFDVRTCPQCGREHGRVYPIDEAPPIPKHLRCRCVYLPVFADPTVDAEINRTQAYSTKGGQTRFRQADRSFEGWLRKQSADTQADFFPSYYKRDQWRAGRITLAKMVRPDGSILTDEEVRRYVNRSRP